MGYLLYYQSPFQDILQIELYQFVKEHTSSSTSVEDRYARSGDVSQSSYRYLQVLCWRDIFP